MGDVVINIVHNWTKTKIKKINSPLVENKNNKPSTVLIFFPINCTVNCLVKIYLFSFSIIAFYFHRFLFIKKEILKHEHPFIVEETTRKKKNFVYILFWSFGCRFIFYFFTQKKGQFSYQLTKLNENEIWNFQFFTKKKFISFSLTPCNFFSLGCIFFVSFNPEKMINWLFLLHILHTSLMSVLFSI